MTTHCGQKFVCHNVFRSLFLSNWKKSLKYDRAMSTLTAPTKPVKIYEYNKRLVSHAETFRKDSVQGQHDAAALLEEMKRNGVQPNSQSYIQLIIRLAWKRHRDNKQNDRLEGWFHDFLRQLVAEHNKHPIPKVTKVIQSFSGRGHPNLKRMFLESCQLFDDLGIDCWNSAISGCMRGKKYQDAEELLNLARQKKITNASSYEILIDTFLFLQDQKSASRIFSYMLEDHVTPSCSLYEKFITYYMTLTPNTEIFETLERLWQAVLMTPNDIPPKLVKSLLNYYRENDRLSTAEQMLLDIKSTQHKLHRDCMGQVWGVISDFADRRQLLSALSLYFDLIGEGYKPSSSVTHKIISTTIKMKDKETGQQLLDLIKDSQQHVHLSQACFDLLSDDNEIK